MLAARAAMSSILVFSSRASAANHAPGRVALAAFEAFHIRR
jgi:hypothetical protein